MQNIIKNTIGLKAVMLVLVGLMLSGCYATVSYTHLTLPTM